MLFQCTLPHILLTLVTLPTPPAPAVGLFSASSSSSLSVTSRCHLTFSSASLSLARQTGAVAHVNSQVVQHVGHVAAVVQSLPVRPLRLRHLALVLQDVPQVPPGCRTTGAMQLSDIKMQHKVLCNIKPKTIVEGVHTRRDPGLSDQPSKRHHRDHSDPVDQGRLQTLNHQSLKQNAIPQFSVGTDGFYLSLGLLRSQTCRGSPRCSSPCSSGWFWPRSAAPAPRTEPAARPGAP